VKQEKEKEEEKRTKREQQAKRVILRGILNHEAQRNSGNKQIN
jgi:DNA-binding TFAR19-related protein (PDSD5 family)